MHVSERDVIGRVRKHGQRQRHQPAQRVARFGLGQKQMRAQYFVAVGLEKLARLFERLLDADVILRGVVLLVPARKPTFRRVRNERDIALFIALEDRKSVV